MTIQEVLRERLDLEPFPPFSIVSSSGRTATIRDPRLVVLMKSRVFIAEPRSDRWTEIPYLHVAAIEAAAPVGRRRKSA